MKQYILLLAIVAVVFTSCKTAYKTGQTPDDVYYSPVRPQDEYVRVEKQEDNSYRGTPEDYYEDRFLRMRMQDRYRWSALDDYYFYNTYAYNAYGNYHSLNSPWNSYWAWNNYYNPYCGGIPYYYPGTIIIKNPKIYTPPSKALVFNPASYNSGDVKTSARSLSNSYNGSSRYNNNNRNSSNTNTLGSSLKKVFSGNNNSESYSPSSNSSSTPSRSYTPSSSSSSSSSGGSSGSKSGGGVSRPPR